MIKFERNCNEHTWLTFDRAIVPTASELNAHYRAEPEPEAEMSQTT